MALLGQNLKWEQAPPKTLLQKIKGFFDPVVTFFTGLEPRERPQIITHPKTKEEIKVESVVETDKLRMPFAKHPTELATGKYGAYKTIPEFGFRLIEVIPKAIAQTLQNYRELGRPETPISKKIGETTWEAGKAPPLKLPFDARRLGFDTPEIESTGRKLVDKFDQLNEMNPPQTGLDVWKNATLSSLMVVVPDALDAFIAGNVASLSGRLALKATKYDPMLERSISTLGIGKNEPVTGKKIAERFGRSWMASENIQQQADTLRSTKYIIDKYRGEGVLKLKPFIQKVQNAARDAILPLEQMGTGFATRPISPVGLGLPGVTTKMYAGFPLDEVAKQQIAKMAKGGLSPDVIAKQLSIGKPIVDAVIADIAKTAITPAIPKELEPLAQEARKYGSAEEFVKNVEKANIQTQEILRREVGYKPEKIELTPQQKRLREMFVGKEGKSTPITEAFHKQFPNLDSAEKIKSQLTDFYTQATKGITEVKPLTEITAEPKPAELFDRLFREPTLMKYITPSNRYARVLGVHELLEPSIQAKTAMEIERAKVFQDIDKWDIEWRKLTGVSLVEKIKEGVKVIPPKGVQNLYNLLDTYSTSAKAGLTGKKAEIFDQIRSLTNGMLERANEVREMVGLEPITKVSSYITHIRDVAGKKELIEKYPFPEEVKYWLTRVNPKHIFNPTAFSRMIEDPKNLLKDPFKALKTMASMDLKQVYLEQPNLLFREELKNLSEQIPASTRQWTEAYINEVIKGYPSGADKIINTTLEATGVKGALDAVLKPFGRTTGFNMSKEFAGQLSRLVHDSVIWGRVKLVIRNHTQKLLSLGLYDTKAFVRGSLPANKELKDIITNSDFWKSSNREFMETSVGLTRGIISKLEKIGFKPYSHSHISNVTHTMKTAYHAGMELVNNPKYAKYKWTKEDVIKEMEYGAQTAQYWYNAMGMPELYRSGLGKTLGNLQSWSQNYATNYWREMLHRGFTGKTGWGKEIPPKWRAGALRHIITSLVFIEGTKRAFGLNYSQVSLLGVLPAYLSPQGQVAVGLANYIFGKSEYQKKTGLNQIKYSITAFIPGSMAWKEFSKAWRGEEGAVKSLFFHTEKPKEKKTQPQPLRSLKMPK